MDYLLDLCDRSLGGVRQGNIIMEVSTVTPIINMEHFPSCYIQQDG